MGQVEFGTMNLRWRTPNLEGGRARREPSPGAPPGGGGAGAHRRLRLFSAGCLVLAACCLTACRLDMHLQPRLDPYQPTDLFKDGRSERPMVPGTVAHGHLRTDTLLYTGRINGVVADEFPFPITAADLERGRQRFNIYCTPCHDYTGSGHGLVVQRGFQHPAPPSYHIDRLVNAPAGHFFDVITHGYGAMYSYASRVSVEDRWRIAAYIRALQLSQRATLAEVPASERAALVGKAP